VSDLFRDVLLGTSRVIWPAGPRVLTLPGRSRAVLAREYLAMAAGTHHHLKAWWRALDGLDMLVAAFLDPADRPPKLRRLPWTERIKRANHLLVRHLEQATDMAHRLVDHDGDVIGMTRAIAERRPPRPGWKPMATRDVYRHEVQPFLPTVHLSWPLVARRMPKFVERYPGLAPAVIPTVGLVGVIEPFKNLDGLLLNDRWVFAAIDAAERWRELAARRSPILAQVLVQVRADWTD
jgi:hypothetical protein